MATDVVLGVNLADAEAFIAANPEWANAEPWSPNAFHRLHKWWPLGRVARTPAAASANRNRNCLDHLYGVLVHGAEYSKRRWPDGVDAF